HETSMIVIFSIFFFQAEDGIRDLYVTGVQTCALPISIALQLQHLGAVVLELERYRERTGRYPATLQQLVGQPIPLRLLNIYDQRSEERRVGKECRSSGAP